MISKDDLRASVGAGILTEKQAASLTALAHSRTGAREGLSACDEPFELFRGFNEIFIMVGLMIVSTGWAGTLAWMLTDGVGSLQRTGLILSLVTATILWVFSEYFIRRRRMVGPAILLTILFAANASIGLTQYFAQVFMVAQEDFSSLVLPCVLSVGAVLLFWLRFRVPFAMAIMALGLFVTALLAAATQSGTPNSIADVFTFSGSGPFAWITLALGLAVFALAMVFDGSDPHRVTRRSAQGFWLHVVAAPAIINTVALSLLSTETGGANIVLIAFLTLFALVAITIDRRSFLLTAIGYVVVVVTTMSDSNTDRNLFILILALGVFMLILGSFWERIRAGILNLLPLGRIRHFLPPAH